MYNNPYMTNFNVQATANRIDSQIAELEKMKQQLQQPVQQPTNLTQNFQLAPSSQSMIKYATSIDDVNKEMVIGDTPFFDKDMSVVWIKNNKGEIKSYALTEIVQKDEKDLMIESLQMQLNEMKGMIENAKSNDADVDESTQSEESTDVSKGRKSKK